MEYISTKKISRHYYITTIFIWLLIEWKWWDGLWIRPWIATAFSTRNAKLRKRVWRTWGKLGWARDPCSGVVLVMWILNAMKRWKGWSRYRKVWVCECDLIHCKEINEALTFARWGRKKRVKILIEKTMCKHLAVIFWCTIFQLYIYIFIYIASCEYLYKSHPSHSRASHSEVFIFDIFLSEVKYIHTIVISRKKPCKFTVFLRYLLCV